GIECMRELAERRDDCLFARSDLVDRAEAQPHQHDRADRDREQRSPAWARRKAEIPTWTAQAAFRAFRTAMLEQIFDIGRATATVFRSAAGQPRVARASRLVLTARRDRLRLVAGIAIGRFLIARGFAPGAALAGHRQHDPVVKPAQTFHGVVIGRVAAKNRGTRTFSLRPRYRTASSGLMTTPQEIERSLPPSIAQRVRSVRFADGIATLVADASGLGRGAAADLQRETEQSAGSIAGVREVRVAL